MEKENTPNNTQEASSSPTPCSLLEHLDGDPDDLCVFEAKYELAHKCFCQFLAVISSVMQENPNAFSSEQGNTLKDITEKISAIRECPI